MIAMFYTMITQLLLQKRRRRKLDAHPKTSFCGCTQNASEFKFGSASVFSWKIELSQTGKISIFISVLLCTFWHSQTHVADQIGD